tara:strand:- start:4 stop:192 length:189 start_codon:yes stop_codon:yes gene_type:complete
MRERRKPYLHFGLPLIYSEVFGMVDSLSIVRIQREPFPFELVEKVYGFVGSFPHPKPAVPIV